MQDRIDGYLLGQMIANAKALLEGDKDRINSLNVFPVPDGDTGTNMLYTLAGGAQELSLNKNSNIGLASKALARAMVLSARGNSGVILSQFFKGLSLYLEGLKDCSVLEFSEAMISGTRRSYEVVSEPTEGTILTLMKEAGVYAKALTNSDTKLSDYLDIYLAKAKQVLNNTPELLPILKEAGVVDSGGAGFILVIEGMLRAAKGEALEGSSISNSINNISPTINTNGFNRNSTLSYGYCTEFILQLLSSKVDINSFSLDTINSYLNTMGNSIVSFKDDDIVKVHIHTFKPGMVLTEMQKYGEFITTKIENMNISHTEEIKEEISRPKPRKKYGMVAVANGEGLSKMLYQIGVDYVCDGGQTMNTSLGELIKAFDMVNAENILVFPNNSNIILAANMARDSYTKSNIIVIPTKTMAEGYSAIAMANFDSDNLDLILKDINNARENVKTLEITRAVRDSKIEGIECKRDEFIAIYDGSLIEANKDRLASVEASLNKIPDIEDKEVFTIILGSDINEEERNKLQSLILKIAPYGECFFIEGNQDVYSYIIGIE